VSRALGWLIGRFLCVYVPAFAVAAVLRVAVSRAIPLVIVITALIALVLIGFSARRGRSIGSFGFRGASLAILGWAAAVSVPPAIGAAVLLNHFHEPGPLAGLHLPTWVAALYFVLAAPIQEELIFRGLLQTTLSNDLATKNLSVSGRDAVSVVPVAVLFAVIHLEVGPLTAFCALILGILAGELRRRSGSLIPAILAHSIFNAAALGMVLVNTA
jgi:membrane protease YdiL (CAAX protease family)